MERNYVIYKKEVGPYTGETTLIEMNIGNLNYSHLDEAEIALAKFLDHYPLMRTTVFVILCEYKYNFNLQR